LPFVIGTEIYLFWISLRCEKCDYKTESFMFSPHWHSWAHAVLIQNLKTRDLRVCWILEEVSSSDADFVSETAANDAFEIAQRRAVQQVLTSQEREVSIAEFFDIEDKQTQLPCPTCGAWLRRQTDGIS
jgi:predicted RNA-binding Zn-ribbon protein involved in translation (DUF1610 family)